jgi:hypothetical protein
VAGDAVNREEVERALEVVRLRLVTAGPPYDSDFLGQELEALRDAVRVLSNVVRALALPAADGDDEQPTAIADEYTYTVVYEAAYWSYDWAVVALFRRSDGAFGVVTESGCSCDSWDPENMAPSGEYTHDLSEVYRRFQAGIAAQSSTFSAAAGFEHMDKMRTAVQEARRGEGNG